MTQKGNINFQALALADGPSKPLSGFKNADLYGKTVESPPTMWNYQADRKGTGK